MSIHVTVIYSPRARERQEITLCLGPSSTVLQAVQASGFFKQLPSSDQASSIGVWGRQASWDQVLRENDRVEIYRPLTVDPKVARRERFSKQGVRTAGLFTNKRAGAKAGY